MNKKYTFSICGNKEETMEIITHLIRFYNLKTKTIKTGKQKWGEYISAVLTGDKNNL